MKWFIRLFSSTVEQSFFDGYAQGYKEASRDAYERAQRSRDQYFRQARPCICSCHALVSKRGGSSVTR